jgi:tripartite-type tricarboxylate transporter receptor subunit TctC
MNFIWSFRCCVLSLLWFAPCAVGAVAEDYPNKPIRLVTPFPAGGPSDTVARLVSQLLGESLGQSVVIDNRGGATGAIGCEIAAKAAPDGYTLLLGSSGNLAVNPSLFRKLPYDPLRDFQPISLVTSGPQVLVVSLSVPARSVKEFIALAKAKPGQLNFASGGSGTSNHLAFELFKLSTGTEIVHIPYKGSGQSLTDVINGRVQALMGAMLLVMPQVKAGKLRALAVTSAQRSSAMPDMPTIAESGLPGFETTSWHGLLVPVKTARSISVRLHDELVRRLKQPETKERLANQGIDAVGNSPEEFAAYIKSESEKWARVIKQVGIKPE